MNLPQFVRVGLAEKGATLDAMSEDVGVCVPTIRKIVHGAPCSTAFRRRAKDRICAYLCVHPSIIKERRAD